MSHLVESPSSGSPPGPLAGDHISRRRRECYPAAYLLDPLHSNATTTVQEDKKFGEEKYDDEALTSDSEGANDDLIAGAFAAKERVKIGDFSVGLSAIERKANEAINNDCKVRGAKTWRMDFED